MRRGPAALFCAVLLSGLTLSVSVWSQTTGATGAYRPPRNTFGQPDLQGIWQALNTAAWDIQDHSEQRFPGLPARFSVPAGQGVVEGSQIPYQTWAMAKRDENFKNRLTVDPEAKCYLPGVPRITYMPYVPTQIELLQTSDHVIILFERARTYRIIPTSALPHLAPSVRLWMGDSRGRWEGNTLVVDVTNQNGRAWFHQAANFHTDPLVNLGLKIYPGMTGTRTR